ncbi:hypothetical protein [uncultured Tateyamaria sp.]|uniref:capsular polysaccharide export protein, LipB/KpsS family n=1 Tax=uncultured Tateyamaria sp. TaxID=455651 RepID=UPI002608E597|nr:hypothetical protein [uncultured Tateyamaria sp.]
MTQMVFHVPRSWLSFRGEGLAPFYLRLIEGLEARDVSYAVEVLDRDALPDRLMRDEAVHVVHHGRFAHPRVRNADVAYIYPFWNFDPKGIRAFSSIADMPFEQNSIDPDIARPFFRRLRKRMVGKRTSRYAQPDAVSDLGPVAAAVFLQSEGHRVVGETCYLDRWEMLDGVCAALDGPIVVKPHPRDRDPATQAGLRERLARFPHLRVSDGNIHDLIAAAARVVTINSAVGIEAYLHRTPVVLCGQSDFHHIADVARSGADLAAILGRRPRKRAYDKFIWWYFADQCLSSVDGDLADRVMARCGLN